MIDTIERNPVHDSADDGIARSSLSDKIYADIRIALMEGHSHDEKA